MDWQGEKKEGGCLRLNIETKLSTVIDLPKASVQPNLEVASQVPQMPNTMQVSFKKCKHFSHESIFLLNMS